MAEDIYDDGLNAGEKKLLEDLLDEDQNECSELGIQRRLFLKQLLAAGGGMLALQMLGDGALFANPAIQSVINDEPPPGIQNGVSINFKVNGSDRSLTIDSRMTLLDALRERLALTGSKKGCDHGQCGACTVIADGRRVLSCLTLAATCEGRSITTIEGLAKGTGLHPMQRSFLKHDGFQCGYCTPGQICSAVALMKEAKSGEISYVTTNVSASTGAVQLSTEEIQERMSGNICRCGAYANIIAAIREVHTQKDIVQVWNSIEENKHSIQ